MFKRIKFTTLMFALLATLSSCATAQSGSPADGTWDFTMSSPFGAVNATVTMSTSGGELSGSFDLGEGRTWPIEEGTVSGNEISFRIDRDGSPLVYTMTAVIDGDSANGSARAMAMEVPWSMTRRS